MPRPKKSTQLHVLHNTLRKHRHGPKPPDGLPPLPLDPPEGMTAAAAVIWKETAARARHLRAIDATMLRIYVETITRWEDASRTVRKEGAIITSPSGMLRPHPALKIVDDSSKIALSLARALRLTSGTWPKDETPVVEATAAPSKWKGMRARLDSFDPVGGT